MKIVVIGAGIVGVCTALKIQELGHEVHMLDRAEPGNGCSFGNAGVLTGTVTGTTAYPGILRDLPALLFSSRSPLSLKWGYLFRMIPWLYAFIQASRRDLFVQNVEALSALVNAAADSYETLTRESGADSFIRRNGVLQLYLSRQSFSRSENERRIREQQGEHPFLLSPVETRSLAPAIGNKFSGAMFRPDVPSLTDSLGFVTALFNYFLVRGGHFSRVDVQDLRSLPDSRWLIRGVPTQSSEGISDDLVEIEADVMIICAGAWSGGLLRRIGLSPLLDTERGYHVCLAGEGDTFNFPVLVSDLGFFMSPMTEGLRLAGTVELGGLDLAESSQGCNLMLATAQSLVPDLKIDKQRRWLGFRPSMPNSVPVIGPIPGKKNAFTTFGHGHLGLTMAAISGEMIARMIEMNDKAHPISGPYRFR